MSGLIHVSTAVVAGTAPGLVAPDGAAAAALAAAPLVYTFVYSPLGGGTWAERELESLRLGVRERAREEMDSRTRYILLSLHARSAAEYALEMVVAPRDLEEPGTAEPAGSSMPWESEMLEGAFEAIGLSPSDLVVAPEVSPVALRIADAILRILDWPVARRTEVRATVGSHGALPVELARRPGQPGSRAPGSDDSPPSPVPRSAMIGCVTV